MKNNLKTDIEAKIKEVLENGKDYGIEYSSQNEILRQFSYIAVGMIED